ncbi:hypothetical protein L6452_39295 [Arctium lappa]|uniref:Uncharacterized protein n=1 Tax=Arctium lappa TaxID=4217 RepID=A0ACB8XSF5_ARCLA|nr:hypothetical protein L6452_39295 [Arctium lappa]
MDLRVQIINWAALVRVGSERVRTSLTERRHLQSSACGSRKTSLSGLALDQTAIRFDFVIQLVKEENKLNQDSSSPRTHMGITFITISLQFYQGFNW